MSMPKAISNTSPLLYLYRVGAIDWLSKLFEEVWTTEAVQNELLGLVDKLEPMLNRLHEAGMWVSADVKRRILKLARE